MDVGNVIATAGGTEGSLTVSEFRKNQLIATFKDSFAIVNLDETS